MALGVAGCESEDEMDDTMDVTKRRFGGAYRKMSAEVRLLYVACLCFILAQYVLTDHRWNSGIRIAALVALIAAQWIGFRARKV